MTAAPPMRLVDALTGTKAPTALFKALSEADEFVKDLDRVHELETRNDELAEELDHVRGLLADKVAECAQMRRECDDLRAALATVGGTP